MRVFFDTSVLVAALVDSHPSHRAAFARLRQVWSQSDTGLVAVHSLAELHATLTAFPQKPRISAADASLLIQRSVLDKFEVVPLSVDDYAAVIEQLATSSLISGVIYDALILRAALKANADHVLTLNEKDFRRVYPEIADKIIVP